MTRPPTFPPGTLTIGELFSGTFATYRARFGMFLLLGAVPALAWLAVMAGFTAYSLADLARGEATYPDDRMGLAALGVVVLVAVGAVVASVVAMIVNLWTHALASLATRALASGHRPRWGELFARGQGFTGRAWAVIVFFVGVSVLSYGLIWLSGAYGGLGVTAQFVSFLELALALLTVGLVYVVPVMAIERTGGVAALRRAWQLASGALGSTLGALVVCVLFVGALAGIASSIGLMVMVMTAGRDGLVVTPAAWTAFLIGETLLIALFLPFVSIYITGMYINRLRDLNGEPPSAHFRHPAPAQRPQGWTLRASGSPPGSGNPAA